MYSLLLIFVWRRKLFILFTSLLFLIGIWAWAIYSTAYNTRGSNDGANDGSANKILTIRQFDDARERIIAKYGVISESQQHLNDARFTRPTDQIGAGRNPDSSLRLRERFQSFSSFFLNKDAEKMLQNLSRDEVRRRKDVDLVHSAAERQSQYERELHRMGVPVIAGIGPGGPNSPNQRLVHLDLKGAPPKISYLKRILPIIKSLGATGLLIEYEDMFPYAKPIEHISAKNAYTEKEIRELLHATAVTGLTVMPLIQTFGHLEFALKLKDYQHLREVPESPQSLCPSLNESINFIETMITQVVGMHQTTYASPAMTNTSASSSSSSTTTNADFLTPNFTHLHVGCDEVYRMGECARCKSKDRTELFLSHVRTVASFVQKKWPHLKVVIWDDMLRQMQLLDLQNSKLGSFVEPMVWVYAEDVYRFVSSQMWDKYATVFPTVWAASAFKGAHGETLIVPPVRRHLENNLKWLSVINAESARFSNGIQGLALTGWQRYDHFAVLCELFAVAIPSLAVILSVTSKGYFDTNVRENHILAALTCPEPSDSQQSRRPWIDMHHDPELNAFAKCMFPGSQAFRFALRSVNTIVEVREYLDDLKNKRGWITAYNIRHNFSSPIRVEELIADAVRHESSLSTMAKNAAESLMQVYDKWTIDEFIEQTTMPLVEELQQMQRHAEQLMAANVWPRRPIPYFLSKMILPK